MNPLSWSEVWRVMTFSAGFNTSVVMTGVTLLGAAAGVVGTFVILRKRALMSDALSHATLPGIGAAFLVGTMLYGSGRSLPVLLLGAALSGIVGVLAVQAIIRFTRLREDAAIGAVLSVFFGLGLVLLSHIQTLGTGDQGGIAKFIYGQTAAMRAEDAALIGLAGLVAVIAAAALYKEFRLVCFDPEFAGSQGWPLSLIDLLMMALVVGVTVIGLQVVGIILVVALIIIPPAAARFWTERLWLMTIAAAVIGGLSGYFGTIASALLPDVPAGAIVVLVAGVFFVASLFLAPARGVLFAAARRGVLRFSVAQEHLLRSLYEAEEKGDAAHDTPVPASAIVGFRRASRPWFRLITALLRRRGLVAGDATGLSLTAKGRAEAARVTRNHRLWEQFLVAYAELAPSHVDRSADLVEHVLSPGMVAELERQLANAGKRLPPSAMPGSVHPLNAAAGGAS